MDLKGPEYSLRGLALAAVAVVLVACGGEHAVAPVGRPLQKSVRPSAAPRLPVARSHRVRPGESLYAIAWIYGLDYRDIATWNRIAEPYTIYPGQRLKLHPRAPQPARPASSRSQTGKRAAGVRKPVRANPGTPAKKPIRSSVRTDVKPAKVPVSKATPYTGATVKKWRWPARGKVIGLFNKSGGKGINIQGRRGQPVYTSAAGRVVYSGSGLRGYGKLIIIKHNKRFLSAYAHNQRLRVSEGDTVKSGQHIADMGDTESRGVKLHFEIRRDGKPVNPSRYLPRSG